MSIAEKVYRGERLSFDDGVEVYRMNDIVAVGRLANHVRERLNENFTYYNVNRHINYTNVCVIDCQLCQGAYARRPGEDGGYTMQLEQVFRLAEKEHSDALTEFHIVGGLNPHLPFGYYLDLLRGLKSRFRLSTSKPSRWSRSISSPRSHASRSNGSSVNYARRVWEAVPAAEPKSLPNERV